MILFDKICIDLGVWPTQSGHYSKDNQWSVAISFALVKFACRVTTDLLAF